MRFARLVTHYWRHAAWLGEDELVDNAHRLPGVPGVLVHGRTDLSSPPDFAWRVHRAWPGSELVLVDRAGHGTNAELVPAVVAATDRLRLPRG
jgi:proline iminopeptidase